MSDKCGSCGSFIPNVRTSSSGTQTPMKHGVCLAKSKFSRKNKTHTAPPGAKFRSDNSARHDLVLQHRDDIVLNCHGFKGAENGQ